MLNEFLYDENGAVSLELAIITVALVALALIFKKQIISLTKTIADKILGN